MTPSGTILRNFEAKPPLVAQKKICIFTYSIHKEFFAYLKIFLGNCFFFKPLFVKLKQFFNENIYYLMVEIGVFYEKIV